MDIEVVGILSYSRQQYFNEKGIDLWLNQLQKCNMNVDLITNSRYLYTIPVIPSDMPMILFLLRNS